MQAMWSLNLDLSKVIAGNLGNLNILYEYAYILLGNCCQFLCMIMVEWLYSRNRKI